MSNNLSLNYNRNKLLNSEYSINFNSNILTLIGENGCGKSAILEKIFEDGIENIEGKNTVVCYTSGKNESFSTAFKQYINNINNIFTKNYEENLLLNSVNRFYFTESWIRVLVFFATSLKNGKTRQYLEGSNTITDRTNLKLNLSFEIPKSYTRIIEEALKIEETEPRHQSLRKSFYHRIITRLAETKIDQNYEETISYKKQKIQLNSFEVGELFGLDVKEIFTFLSVASIDNRFLTFNDSILKFDNGLELSDLSDGEYQFLVIFSIIDLFDAEETLLLLDEIDSHLHFDNIKRLWKELKSFNGHIATTTHIADSILCNDIKNLKPVKYGKVENEIVVDYLLKRLNTLTESKEYEFKVAAQAEYLALVENKNDWIRFRELVKIKVPDFNEEIFKKIHYIECSSGYSTHNQEFADSKKQWIAKFKEVNRNTCKTKVIFFICDRDNLPLESFNQDGVSIASENNIVFKNQKKCDVLAWKRKEIENYYLSYTLLSSHNLIDEVNEMLPQRNHIRENDLMDIEPIRTLEIKDIIKTLFCLDQGIDEEKMIQITKDIPASEISEDIEKMYNYIKNKLQRTP
ncbi:MAG: AAA family ATPase [Candidatus Cloacimonetes bacterium]|nr:AAA family ATPase [Candidatus Cloacimonadota bacterium]